MIGTKLLLILAVALVPAAACKKEGGAAKEAPRTGGAQAATDQRIAVSVTENGFEPSDIAVSAAGDIYFSDRQPVRFVFERKTDKTCAKQVIIHVDDANKIEKELPLHQPVEVAVTFPRSGDITYACGMDMVKGSIHVQ